MKILEQLPLEINQPTTSGLQHISEILPGVMASIFKAAQVQQNQPAPDTRSAERDEWRIAA